MRRLFSFSRVAALLRIFRQPVYAAMNKNSVHFKLLPLKGWLHILSKAAIFREFGRNMDNYGDIYGII